MPLRGLRLRAKRVIGALAQAAPDANVPQKYVASCGGDVAEARRRWDDTRRWRKAERVDGILAEPRPLYGAIRRCYPHYYAGSGRDGQPVYVENVGRVDVDGLAEAGVDADAMLRHYVFLNEWTWRELQPAADGPASYNVTVLDLDGLKLAQCRGDEGADEAVDQREPGRRVRDDHEPAPLRVARARQHRAPLHVVEADAAALRELQAI